MTTSVRRRLVALLLTALVAGCSKGWEGAPVQQAPVAAQASEPGSRSLAYERAVSAEVEEGKLDAVFGALQARCSQLTVEGCEVLASSLSTVRSPSASLRLRASEKGSTR